MINNLTAWLIACMLLPISLSSQVESQHITLEDIWLQNKFTPETIRGMNPMKDGNSFAMLTDTSINTYAYESGELSNVIVRKKDLCPEGSDEPIQLKSYSMNHDESMMLIPTDLERVYRHSTQAFYYLFDLKNKSLQPLSENGKQRLATFSPNGEMVAFVRNNNIFVKHLSTNKEQQITFDGVVNEIINGTTDWVYEEEFAFTQAFFWSPDSRKIAYYRFDESEVREYQMSFYGELYPELYSYRYPKAGENNSKVSIHVYSLDENTSIKVDIEADQKSYIPGIQWTTNDERLAIQHINRHQNHLKLFLTDAATGISSIIYEETNPYYIEITDNLMFLPDKQHFIISSEKDGFNHIYLYNIDGDFVNQLTKGRWDVAAIYGYDAEKREVYYQSAETTPLERHIFAVGLNGTKRRLTFNKGYNSASFSSNMQFFVNSNTTANTPHYITVNRSSGGEIRVLKDNQELTKKCKAYRFSTVEFFEIADSSFILPNGEYTSLHAYRILPPDFNPNHQYPVMLYVYGGPGSQTVTNSWGGSNYLWFQLLAQKGIIVVSVDNRGTGARGEQFKKMTYLQLGKYETEDIIATARYLGQLNYVDKERIAIFGWSYGGFLSSLAITKGADYFKSAIAVAPVTNWRYYDNIYTERYMRTPNENPDGYDHNSPVNFSKKLKGDYLLVHGSADDNVHYQNTMEMVNALIQSDKKFELMIYPDRNHSIYGGNTRFHLFNLMTDFLERNLLHKAQTYEM